jgi:hypothetical protein
MGWIVYDLLPAVALIACGLYVASDFLRSRGLIDEARHNQIKPLGSLIAVAAAAATVLHLFVGGWILF